VVHNSHFCPDFHHAVELIGRRWSGAILREMLGGATRFTEIRSAIPDISDRMLSERLKELEAAGIVTRRVHAETPVRVEYQLTRKGGALEKVLAAIGEWANEWCDRSAAPGDPAA
jgi:DNA-binding HxlR family transcriptional regulator